MARPTRSCYISASSTHSKTHALSNEAFTLLVSRPCRYCGKVRYLTTVYSYYLPRGTNYLATYRHVVYQLLTTGTNNCKRRATRRATTTDSTASTRRCACTYYLLHGRHTEGM